ncbi:MAG: hypothetical protein QME44_10610 [Thermodesulfobacteriota bacterium]|nr:hypothetical protein [Thermodesulfobacteriota bacterium]
MKRVPKLTGGNSISFVVMKELGITTCFTFDEHFRQMGFTVFP